MRFITITPEEFRAYAENSPYKSFMQTPEIATYREGNGWTPYYLAVAEGETIKAATMLVAKPTFLGKSLFIAPGGPLMDLEDTTLTEFFFRHLRRYLKSHNAYVLHIDPYYELIERDRDGAPAPNGFNHKSAVNNLKKLGFRRLNHATQPQYLFTLDIAGRTPDELLANFKRNTRNHIKKATKMGVKVRELTREELPILKDITAATAARRDFIDKPLSYYQQIYDLFHDRGEVKFMVAEVGATGTMCHAGHDNSARAARSVPEGHAVSAPSNSKSLPLSAAMFILYGDEIIYLFSGSDEQYMKDYNAQYAIQWHMIEYAAQHGFKTYNFYGISGLPVNGDLDGIYEFKKGFASDSHGHVVELIGSFELPINQPFYHLHQFLSKLKHRK